MMQPGLVIRASKPPLSGEKTIKIRPLTRKILWYIVPVILGILASAQVSGKASATAPLPDEMIPKTTNQQPLPMYASASWS